MKRMEPLNRDELLRLLKAARESGTRDWCLLVLMYHHGLRATEAGQLLRSDLNEVDWTLNVKRLKGSNKTLQTILPNGIKLLDARKAVTEWFAERPSGGYLFPNPQGAPWYKSSGWSPGESPLQIPTKSSLASKTRRDAAYLFGPRQLLSWSFFSYSDANALPH